MAAGISPPAVSEAAFQRAIVDLAQRGGWRVFHAHDSRRQVKPGVHVGDKLARGFPDLVLCRPPRLIAAELKTEKGRLSAGQEEWLGLLDGVPSIEAYVWRPSGWPEIERLLARRS